jgi:IS5 family transposase
MLRLSDEGIEDAIYDSQAIRAFVGIDLARESAPDATPLLKFRHLLEAKELTRQIFDAINGHLAEKGLMMREGTIVDATLIAAPPSTKNNDGKRDPGMHQSKKGNDWRFGMKAHIGVDAASGLVHSVVGTAGNVSDVTQAHVLLHGDETAPLGDVGYQGVEKRRENVGKAVTWHAAMKRSKRKALSNNKLRRMAEKLEHLKASMRAKVEHPFHFIKNLFRHRKTRYRGLAKNTAQLFTLFGFANLMLAGRRFSLLKLELRPERRKAQTTLLICKRTGCIDPGKAGIEFGNGRVAIKTFARRNRQLISASLG